MSKLFKFDQYISDNGPAALVIREQLMPVEGTEGVVFPATFAAGDGFSGGYNINSFGDEKDGRNVCLIDSIGSQANRIEPLFMKEMYRHLVPQLVVKVTMKVNGEDVLREVNILQVGHRAGDALFRCSAFHPSFQSAFRQFLAGNAVPLAKAAPTSLVFGVWDSRDTQAKLPRLIGATIRAFNVRKLTRGAVYVPPVDYSQLDVFSEEDKAKAEGNAKSPLAQRGFVHNPASASHGGVIADGGIRRDASLNLAALRHLYAGTDEASTRELRRYILGLALVAFTAPGETYLRQGCLLVRDPEQTREFSEVHADGRRVPCGVTHDEALAFATEAALAFGVGESSSEEFDKQRAQKDVKEEEGGKQKGKRAAKKEESPADQAEAKG